MTGYFLDFSDPGLSGMQAFIKNFVKNQKKASNNETKLLKKQLISNKLAWFNK
jgi:hypothetical protein